ncbi:MAG: ribosome recycling factor [Firmicutes bacterium]|nr:ribosome recycling factor [Bacillota bacterium]
MSDKTKVFEEKMEKTVKNLESELQTIRAGRANPHVLDKIKAECYGMEMPVNQLANIATPEARVITITPYDVSTLKAIEKAINTSELGIHPNNDGKVIRLVFPELTEERRKGLTKDVKKKGEDSKVAVRNIRRDAVDKVKKMEKASEITEDELKNLETEIQKLTDKYVAEIDKLVEAKNKDIMSI